MLRDRLTFSNMNNLCSLFRCSVISFQRCNQPVCTAIKKFELHQYQSCRSFCSEKSSSSSNFVYGGEIDEFESIEESPYASIDLSHIAGNDPEKMKTLDLLRLEMHMMYQDGSQVPRKLSERRWNDLLRTTSRAERVMYLRYLWLNETKDRANREKRTAKKNEFIEQQKSAEPRIKRATDSPMLYALGNNSLFHRVYDTRMSRVRNYRLFQAMRFGRPIFVDCSYEPYMSLANLGRCSEQLFFSWASNRLHCYPLHLVFCNMNPDSTLLSRIRHRIPNLDDPDVPFFYTSKHYTDLYPKNRLVYLTADAPDELINLAPEDVYIVGGFVDKSKVEPLAMMKAKKEGLRMAKFPLDRYLRWKMGIKTLTINQAVAIVNDFQFTRNWNVAFKNVPGRKIVQDLGPDDRNSQLQSIPKDDIYHLLINDRKLPWKK